MELDKEAASSAPNPGIGSVYFIFFFMVFTIVYISVRAESKTFVQYLSFSRSLGNL